MKIEVVIHILRYPNGFSEEEVCEARRLAANKLEQLQRLIRQFGKESV